MTYKVNDIFYSLQGEGHNAGCPAIFIRFSGCNLQCSFCDTDFSQYKKMTATEIIDSLKICIKEYIPTNSNVSSEGKGLRDNILCVLTGGEPTLQVDEELIDMLHSDGFKVAMESNGTILPPKNLDWFTVSPKNNPTVKHCNELKVLFDDSGDVNDFGISADYYYLQPCDMNDKERNSTINKHCVDYILKHTRWRLSVQTHKLLNFK